MGKISLVVDFEFTCWRGRPPKGNRTEIIEIGICAFDHITKKIKNAQSIYIKPESEISAFCTELTGITPELLNKKGISFQKACDKIQSEYRSKTKTWFAWGYMDEMQMRKDCKRHKVRYPMGQRHINVSTLFSIKHGLEDEYGLSRALEHVGLKFDGNKHSGKDDAYNTARVLRSIFE